MPQSSTRRFSANLGYLFKEHALPDAIRAAHSAGFAAVECHFPYDVPSSAVRAALEETGLPMLSINTHPGDLASGDFGLAALPGREDQARAAIDQAVGYARDIGARAIHVMAGKTGSMPGENPRVEDVFAENLAHACAQAARHDIGIVIEAINRFDVPGYHLFSAAHAARTIDRVSAPNLSLTFDCYHSARMGADPLESYRSVAHKVSHIQFAGVPDRGDPAIGEVDYSVLLPALCAAGHAGYFGAEYKTSGPTEAGLGWMGDIELPPFNEAVDS